MILRWTSRWAVGPLGFVIGLTASGYWDQPQAKTVPLNCTNNVSGYHWNVPIDFDRSSVNSNPAQITPATISWFEAREKTFYDLDRGTGALVARVPSAFGGYFLYHSCHIG